MQPYLTALPYQPNAILEYFSELSEQPWTILLYSGTIRHSNSRYDILVNSPVATLITRNGITEICRNGHCKNFYDDPFELVQKNLAYSKIIPLSNESFPFLGGAVGYFGYDLVRSVENLPDLAKEDIKLPEMAIGIYHWAIIADHYRHQLTLLSYDDPSLLLSKLKSFSLQKSIKPFRILKPWKTNMTRDEYGQKFRKIKEHFLAGDCYQICLGRRFSAPYSGNESTEFRRLINYNQAPFSAFFRLDDRQVVMSFSPERFLYLRNKKIQTRPIKGTLPRLPNMYDDHKQAIRLATSEKDKTENLMIVDLLRSDIGRVAQPGSVRVPSLFTIETFTTVHHMVSTITATLNTEHTSCDLLRACFPGGSVTGVPKIRAMEIIENLEPQRRSVWCGSIGYISFCGTMDTNIAIRTLLMSNGNVYYSVGSGLIFDSDEEREYQETITKTSSVLPYIKIISALNASF